MRRGGRKAGSQVPATAAAAAAAVETCRGKDEHGAEGKERELDPGTGVGADIVAGRGARTNRRGSRSSPSSTTCRRPSPPASPPSASSLLRAAVDEWTRRTGVQPDAAVRIEGRCFRLHKEPLAAHSCFLRHRLQGVSDITLPTPSPASPDVFAAAALFCYGSEVRLTASNVAALRVAAEWLQMSGEIVDRVTGEEDDGYISGDGDGDGDGNRVEDMTGCIQGPSLLDATERCFGEAVAKSADTGQAASLLRSCFQLIPRSPGAAAGLAGRCMEAMEEAGRGGEYAVFLTDIPPGDFRNIAASVAARNCQCHDLLYAIVDRYLQARGTDLTDEEKSRLCTPICCALLTRPLLVHLVQNPRMPLRFVVQAMLAEHYNTRRSLLVSQTPSPFAVTAAAAATTSPSDGGQAPKAPLTLGDILEREAAVRQQAGLRAAAQATSFRIYTLERDIAAMRRKLREVAVEAAPETAAVASVGTAAGGAGAGRSQSCRFLNEMARPGKAEWGDYYDEEGVSAGTCSGRFAYEVSDSYYDDSVRSAVIAPNAKEVRPKRRSSVGSAMLRGLKSVFRSAAWTGGGKAGGGGGRRRFGGGMGCTGDGDVVSVGVLSGRNLRNS